MSPHPPLDFLFCLLADDSPPDALLVRAPSFVMAARVSSYLPLVEKLERRREGAHASSLDLTVRTVTKLKFWYMREDYKF